MKCDEHHGRVVGSWLRSNAYDCAPPNEEDKQSVAETFFLDPQWICDVLTTVVTSEVNNKSIKQGQFKFTASVSNVNNRL